MKNYTFKNKSILLISNESWGDIWYSKHNYAYELSKENKVYFINASPGWSLRNIFRKRVRLRAYTENLIIVDYFNYLPIINEYFNRLNNKWVSKVMNRVLKKDGMKEVVFWTFDPVRLFHPHYFNPELSLFHCVDLYQDRPHIYELCNRVDGIVMVSEAVGGMYDQFELPKTYVPHGISKDNFEFDPNFKLDVDLVDYALFIGVLDDRIDVDLFEKAVKQHPELPFLVVGPFGHKGEKYERLKQFFEGGEYANLHVIGVRHFQVLKYYVQKAKLCLTFMDPTLFGNDIGHHKTLVYLTQGKPIVGYAFKEYIGQEEIMYMAKTHEENLEQLRQLLENGEEDYLIQKRIDFAKSYLYENQINKIEEFANTLDKFNKK